MSWGSEEGGVMLSLEGIRRESEGVEEGERRRSETGFLALSWWEKR